MFLDKRPNQYAHEIMQLKTREERAEYLNTQVPEHLRAMTKCHVETAHAKAKAKKCQR